MSWPSINTLPVRCKSISCNRAHSSCYLMCPYISFSAQDSKCDSSVPPWPSSIQYSRTTYTKYFLDQIAFLNSCTIESWSGTCSGKVPPNYSSELRSISPAPRSRIASREHHRYAEVGLIGAAAAMSPMSIPIRHAPGIFKGHSHTEES